MLRSFIDVPIFFELFLTKKKKNYVLQKDVPIYVLIVSFSKKKNVLIV